VSSRRPNRFAEGIYPPAGESGKQTERKDVKRQQPVPLTLHIAAALCIVVGVISLIDMVLKLALGQIFFNLTALLLFVGLCLLAWGRCRWGGPPPRRRFTAAEFERVKSLATNATWEECRADDDYLLSMIRIRLGIRGPKAQLVFDRARKDPDHLDWLIQDHMDGLCETRVLDLLPRNRSGAQLAEDLGFDPFDPRRERAYRGASRFWNGKRQLVLAAGIVALLLTVLYPPWAKVTREDSPGHSPLGNSPRVSREFIGYHYLIWRDKPLPPPRNRTDLRYPPVVYDYDLGILGLEWLGVSALVTVTCLVLRNKEYRPEAFAQQPYRPVAGAGLMAGR
jgi:hypothetical protein